MESSESMKAASCRFSKLALEKMHTVLQLSGIQSSHAF